MQRNEKMIEIRTSYEISYLKTSMSKKFERNCSKLFKNEVNEYPILSSQPILHIK